MQHSREISSPAGSNNKSEAKKNQSPIGTVIRSPAPSLLFPPAAKRPLEFSSRTLYANKRKLVHFQVENAYATWLSHINLKLFFSVSWRKLNQIYLLSHWFLTSYAYAACLTSRRCLLPRLARACLICRP